MKKSVLVFVILFMLMLNVKASTVLIYNNSSEKLQDYYEKISKGYPFLNSNAGLISKNEYKKTLLNGTQGSTFLYNGKSFLFSDVNNDLALQLEANADFKNIKKDEVSSAKLSVLLKKDIEVKGSGTRADPYIFVDASDIRIVSMKKDGINITEVPTEGRYDFSSYCIGGIASYSNTTHELNIKITHAPAICSLEFNEMKTASIVAYIYGANTEKNEKDIVFGENGNIDYILKSGYINEEPYMYCENGTTLTYSSTQIIVNNVLIDDTCHIVFPKEITADESYVVPVSGTYKIEGWGAQGANYSSTYTGGKGGYISGKTSLSKSDSLVIKIGKQDGTNGGGKSSSSNTYNGGGSTRIIKDSTAILTAAGGGGASRSNSGGAGGSGTGAGGTSVGSGGGTSGQYGGGGSSSLDYDGRYWSTCNGTCKTWQVTYSSYQAIGEGWYACEEAGGTLSTIERCGTGSGYCSSSGVFTCTSKVRQSRCSISRFNGNQLQESGCKCAEYNKVSCLKGSYYYGNPGQGGKSILGTGVTQLSKTDGNNTGDGKVKITIISK